MKDSAENPHVSGTHRALEAPTLHCELLPVPTSQALAEMMAYVNVLIPARTLGLVKQCLCPLLILVHINRTTTEMWLNKIQHQLYCLSTIAP